MSISGLCFGMAKKKVSGAISCLHRVCVLVWDKNVLLRYFMLAFGLCFVMKKKKVRPFIMQYFLRFKNGPFLPLLFVISFLNFLVRV